MLGDDQLKDHGPVVARCHRAAGPLANGRNARKPGGARYDRASRPSRVFAPHVRADRPRGARSFPAGSWARASGTHGRRLAADFGVLGQLVFQKFDSLFAGIEADDQFPHLLLQSVDACVHLQQHPHHGLLPGAVNGLSLFARQHAHNSRRKPWIRG